MSKENAMSKEDAIKNAEAFLKYCNSQETFICPQCDLEVGYICEFCQSLIIISDLKYFLKKDNNG